MRKKSDQTRRKTLESAYYLFYRKGFVRVNVDEVAARAGITKRTLYSYFRSKDDLLAAALLHYSALDLERLRVIGARMPPTRGAKIVLFVRPARRMGGHAALDRLRLHAACRRVGRSSGASCAHHWAPREIIDRALADGIA